MRKFSWVLILVLLLGCFAGCQKVPSASRPIENADGTLSDWMKEEIKAAYKEAHGITLYWDLWEESNSLRYYGTENGYVFLYREPGLMGYGELIIGDKVFLSNYVFFIEAYKDGKFIKLEDALKQGLVSESTIEKIWERHQEYEARRKENRA